MLTGHRGPTEYATTAVQIESWISGTEVYGIPITAREVRHLFRGIHRTYATYVLSSLSLFADSVTGISLDHEAAYLLRQLFDTDTYASIETVARGTRRQRPVVFRQQLLIGLLHAQKYGRDWFWGKKPPIAQQNHQLGRALLGLSDLLNQKIPRPTTLGEKAAFMMPLYSGSPADAGISLSIIHQQLDDPEWQRGILKDLAARFEADTGLTTRNYVYFLLGLVAGLKRERATALTGQRTGRDFVPSNIDLDSLLPFLKNGIAERALADASIGYRELRRHVAKASQEELLRDHSFEPLRSKPFIKLPDNRYLCSDYQLLLERLSNGVYWSLLRRARDKKEEGAFFNAWGGITESHVRRRLESVYSSDFWPRPRTTSGNEVADMIRNEDPCLILIEVKMARIPDPIKYGGSSKSVEEVIRGEKVLKWGQLARAWRWLFKHDDRGRSYLAKPNEFCHLGVRTVHPVLIALDPAVCAPLVEAYTARLCAAYMRCEALPRRPKVMPLQVLSLEDLERVMNFLGEGFTLKNLLATRLRLDPERHATFHNFIYDTARRSGISAGADGNVQNEMIVRGTDFWIGMGMPASKKSDLETALQ